MKQAFDAIVSGRVQMVMFRNFVQRKGSALGLMGEVENLSDGTVRVRAEGEKQQLQSLIELLKRGPMLAHVESVSVTWVEPPGSFQGFSIHY